MSGRFVVFEGLDGAGTTTQAALLATALRRRGVVVAETREPTTGPLGAVVRQAIEGRVALDPAALALAFAADRADHLFNERDGIAGQLAADRWVVCDRYLLSSLAYQPSEGLDLSWVQTINAAAIEPDVTIFLDVDPEIALERISGRSSSDERFHALEQLQRVRNGYGRALDADAPTGELLVVDGTRDVRTIAEEIEERVASALSPPPRPAA